jgi:protein-S-isoprenylcysteine O-methyltransferase Ste14
MMTDTKAEESKFTIRAVIGFMAYLFLNPLILFLSAGTTKWGMAWAYFSVSILGMVVSRVIAIRKNPDLLEERARYQESDNVKSWDKVLVPIAALYGPMVTIIVAGLDMRFGWTIVFPLWFQLLALLVGIIGLVIASWAMVENRFFSAVVRIQDDRDHSVCDTGPYRYIRHPGYAGGILFYLITPVVLNSIWAYIPISISVIATVVRTALEDQLLVNELPGYREYTQKTRFRLLPGVW